MRYLEEILKIPDIDVGDSDCSSDGVRLEEHEAASGELRPAVKLGESLTLERDEAQKSLVFEGMGGRRLLRTGLGLQRWSRLARPIVTVHIRIYYVVKKLRQLAPSYLSRRRINELIA